MAAVAAVAAVAAAVAAVAAAAGTVVGTATETRATQIQRRAKYLLTIGIP